MKGYASFNEKRVKKNLLVLLIEGIFV